MYEDDGKNIKASGNAKLFYKSYIVEATQITYLQEADQVIADIERLNLQDNVLVLGERSDVPSLMAAADAYLMSSVVEGLPMVLLEAAAMKLPIVCTNVGGNADVVADGQSGFVVPTQDSSALADAIVKLQSMSSEKRRRWGTHGHQIVMEEFAMEAIARAWIQLYEDRIEAAGGARRWGIK